MKFQGNPKDWGQGGSPPPPSSREATTPPSAPRRGWTLPHIPKRVPQKPSVRPGFIKQIHRLQRLSQIQIDGAPEFSDALTPALELIAGLTPVGRGYMLARDVWGYFGPQQEETPAIPASYDNNGWVVRDGPCGPFDTFFRTVAPIGSCGLASGAGAEQWGSPSDIIAQYPYTSRLSGGVWSGPEPTRYRHNMSWERGDDTPHSRPDLAPIIYPEVPAIPGTRTVQPVPATVTPPLPAITQPMPQPRDTSRPAPVIPGFRKPIAPTLPSQRPANTIEVRPGGVSIPPQVPHVQAPAPGKELKINTRRGSAFYKAISNLYNGATEADDFVEVVANSLEGNPCKGLKPVEQSICIGQNWDKINVDKLVYGLIYNHFEDKAVGAFMSFGKKAPYGVQLPTNAWQL